MYDSYFFGWLVTLNICFCSWYITVNSYFKFLLKRKIYYLLFLVNIYKIDYLYLLLFNFSLFLYICSAIFNHLHFCLSFKYLLLLLFPNFVTLKSLSECIFTMNDQREVYFYNMYTMTNCFVSFWFNYNIMVVMKCYNFCV